MDTTDAGTPPAESPLLTLDPADVPNVEDLVTEDDTPLDSIYTEKQQRLLTEPLYSSWRGPEDGQPFLALANVGLFAESKKPPLVPDFLLSLEVSAASDLRAKENRSYFMWIFGKPPDVVVEIVSDRRGGEADVKMRAYARIGVVFYVIYDPDDLLEGGVLRAFTLNRRRYEAIDPRWLPEVGLGLVLWPGAFEGPTQTWLRWCDRDGRVIPTGAERAEEERRRAEEEGRRAEETAERLRRLEAQLRALGQEPEA